MKRIAIERIIYQEINKIIFLTKINLMKTKLLLPFLALFYFKSLAQDSPKKFTYGVRVTSSNASVATETLFTPANMSLDINSISSFTISGFAEHHVGKLFYIQGGLNYIVKGYKQDIIGIDDVGKFFSLTSDIKGNYIEIPIYGLFRFNAGKGNFFIGAGPYAAIGINGKIKTELFMQSTTSSNTLELVSKEEEKTNFGNSTEDDFKNLDFGANIQLGYEFKKGFNLGLSLGLGIYDVSPNNNKTMYHNNLGLSLGYRLK